MKLSQVVPNVQEVPLQCFTYVDSINLGPCTGVAGNTRANLSLAFDAVFKNFVEFFPSEYFGPSWLKNQSSWIQGPTVLNSPKFYGVECIFPEQPHLVGCLYTTVTKGAFLAKEMTRLQDFSSAAISRRGKGRHTATEPGTKLDARLVTPTTHSLAWEVLHFLAQLHPTHYWATRLVHSQLKGQE